MNLANYFKQFRNHIIGIDDVFESPYGTMPLVYTDWTASGRLYAPIEKKISEEFGPFVANTHTKTSISGSLMTTAYEQAKKTIKNHVNADENDILIQAGNGMTASIIKLQRLLGLKIDERYAKNINLQKHERPVVFITHMEHHSNQTSWLETIAEVQIIPYLNKKEIDFEAFEELLQNYKTRPLKIASVTACSNVTGFQTDYYQIAQKIHAVNGYCFVDFACSAPYVNIDMHPLDESQQLDAVFFSPHKFLGGPGTSGILIMNKKLYRNTIPDHPGGGTVLWTNPWGEHQFHPDPEVREDGGTPGFLQAIKTALAIKLKEKMGVENIMNREHEIIQKLFITFKNIENINLLADNFSDRLGIFSFVIDGLDYNLGVRLLNDRYGIQTRGGCSCAGTYGHILLGVDRQKSNKLSKQIEQGHTKNKPGWIRLSIHPTTSNEEIAYISKAISELASNYTVWQKDYKYINNQYVHKNYDENIYINQTINDWFRF